MRHDHLVRDGEGREVLHAVGPPRIVRSQCIDLLIPEELDCMEGSARKPTNTNVLDKGPLAGMMLHQ